MAVSDPVQRTLNQNRFAFLHRARLEPCRVTITATSNAEFNGVKFRTKTWPARITRVFEANEVHLGLFATLPQATIEAAPPEGVATVDITYVIKTGADAG
jgi:hypothetical protein